MKSSVTRDFRKQFARLPKDVQKQARRTFQIWQQDPFHPGLHFKRVNEAQAIYSVRIGLGYRALGRMMDGAMVWFWIGSHNDYDKLLRQL